LLEEQLAEITGKLSTARLAVTAEQKRRLAAEQASATASERSIKAVSEAVVAGETATMRPMMQKVSELEQQLAATTGESERLRERSAQIEEQLREAVRERDEARSHVQHATRHSQHITTQYVSGSHTVVSVVSACGSGRRGGGWQVVVVVVVLETVIAVVETVVVVVCVCMWRGGLIMFKRSVSLFS
jgi:hypothetical protein